MILASIDLGSNSVILLIMEYNSSTNSIIKISDFYTTPRISESLTINDGISELAIGRLENVLMEFNRIIKDSRCEQVIVSATNAFRIAKNAIKLKKFLEEKYKWKISILKGEEEAWISFLGAIIPEYQTDNSLLIDIGGGSTEVVFGNSKNIDFRRSLQLGVVSLKELFFSSNESLSNSSIEHARKHIVGKLSEIQETIQADTRTLAVAGTPTTLSAIINNVKNYSNELVNNTILKSEQVAGVCTQLQQMTPKEMRTSYGTIVEGREDLLVGGCLILEEFMKYFKINEVIVSTRGLRYGAIYDYLIKNNLYAINK
ncbi:MAG: hypothetical protein HYZ10_00550 [Ignavibacteriales bacterium]|nr:hypothetical protein [Ignavibacteriales bacterium]